MKRIETCIIILFVVGFCILYAAYLYSPSTNQPTMFVASDKNYGSIVVGEVISVYDGDTFKITIPEWPEIVGDNISVRIGGIDTPERRGTSGCIKKLSDEAQQVTATALGDANVIELRNIRRGKYFRLIADVYIDNKSLANILLNKGLAKLYDGGTRPKWTKGDCYGYVGRKTTH